MVSGETKVKKNSFLKFAFCVFSLIILEFLVASLEKVEANESLGWCVVTQSDYTAGYCTGTQCDATTWYLDNPDDCVYFGCSSCPCTVCSETCYGFGYEMEEESCTDDIECYGTTFCSFCTSFCPAGGGETPLCRTGYRSCWFDPSNEGACCPEYACWDGRTPGYKECLTPTCPTTLSGTCQLLQKPTGEYYGKVTLNWSDVGYEYEYRISRDSTVVTSVNSNITTWTDPTELTPGTTYTYNVDPKYRYSWTGYGYKSCSTTVICQPSSFATPPPGTIIVDFGISPTGSNGWFQTQEGDVYSGGQIRSQVPAGKNFSLDGSGGFPGIVSFNGDNADFSPGEISSKKWLANTPAKANFYDYFYLLLGSPDLEDSPGEIRNEDLPAEDGVRAYSGDIQTGNTWQIGARKMVISTDGKFLIKHRILISQGGSLVVVAKGGIGVSKNLTATGEQNNYLGGIFITDGTFYSSVEENFNFTPVTSEKILVVQGGVIAKQVSLTRDLGEDNQTFPAEKFVFRPDFLINSYPFTWKTLHTWQELVP